MAASGGLVLVLKFGSATVKFAVLAPASGARVLGGVVEKVCTPEAALRIRGREGGLTEEKLPEGDHHAAISLILDHLADAGEHGGPARLLGAGHRVVHGGDRFTASVLVDDEVIAAIRDVRPAGAAAQPGEPGRHRGGQCHPARTTRR